MIFLGRHIEIEDPRVFALNKGFCCFFGQFLHIWGRLNRCQALLLVQKAPENLLRHIIMSGPIHCIFGVGGDKSLKICHQRTSPKLHVVWTARSTHEKNPYITWRSFNTSVFLRGLHLDKKSTWNPKLLHDVSAKRYFPILLWQFAKSYINQ